MAKSMTRRVCVKAQKFAIKFLEKLEDLEDWECLDKIIWVCNIVVFLGIKSMAHLLFSVLF